MIQFIYSLIRAFLSKFYRHFTLCLFFLLTCFPFETVGEEIFDSYPPHIEREARYRYPTERFIDAYGWENISSGLKNLGVSMVHRNLFDRIWHREELGFLGYHGSTQEYRIYQDIIKWILEEHLNIVVKDDFHFFRIPGDPQFNFSSLEEYGDYRWNYSPTHFLCMNYALYGNFQSPGSCSYYYFADNSSLTSIDYESKLIWLFDKIEIDTSLIHKAFSVGRHHLGAEKGVLIQVFDMSHFNPWKEFYALSDVQCGSFTNLPISEIIKSTSPTPFPWQIRMLMSNKHTLNPHSSLIIKRYDTLDPQVIKEYEQEIKRVIKSMKPVKEKVHKYREELFTVWEVNND